MKKILMCLSLLMVMISSLQDTKADLSTPNIKIIVENSQGDYYLDLLVNDEIVYEVADDYLANYQSSMIEVLKNYNQDGYHALNVVGSSSFVIGNIEPLKEDEHYYHLFEFEGVPEEFKIMIVDQDLNVKVSEIQTKTNYQQTYYLDYQTMEIEEYMPMTMISDPFIILMSISLILEGALFYFFGFDIKKNLKPFIMINSLTTVLFSIAMMILGRTYGVFTTLMLVVPLLEALVLVIEWLLTQKYFVYDTKKQLSRYVLASTVLNYIVSLIIMMTMPAIFF